MSQEAHIHSRTGWWPEPRPRLVEWVIGCLLGILAVGGASGQLPVDSLLTVATTQRGSGGEAWVYVAWSAGDPAVLHGRRFAIYRKPGRPEDAGAFTQVALVGGVTLDPAILADWIARGGAVGDRVADLTSSLDFLVPDPAVTTAADAVTKLRAALNLASSQPPVQASLELLADRYHAVRLALGRAWLGRMPVGPTTLEIREWDASTGADRWVVARLSVNVGAPEPLPAPGAPIVVQNRRSADTLRAGLVWSEPDALRRRGPLVAGFDLWRVGAAVARAKGWDARPPSLVELAGVAEKVTEDLVRPRRHWNEGEALAGAKDPAQAFWIDSGPIAEPWRDGEEFAWFVVAQDALGNSGASSPAGFGFVCALTAPEIPRGLAAGNVFLETKGGAARQRIRLQWDGRAPESRLGGRFEIFRGRGELPAVASTNEPPAALRVGAVDANGEASRFEWLDDSLDPASDPGLFGAGFWYAVRAVRETPCGPVVSALCPPVVVSLRRFEAPDAPDGELGINCPRVVVRRQPNVASVEPLEAPWTLERHFQIRVQRRDRGVAWAEVTLTSGLDGKAVMESPRLRFGAEDDVVEYSFVLSKVPNVASAVVGQVVAGGFSGAFSEPVTFEMTGNPEPGTRSLVSFEAATVSMSEVGSGDLLATGLGIGPFPLNDATRDDSGNITTRSPDSNAWILIEAMTPGSPAGTPWRRVTLTRAVTRSPAEGPRLFFRDLSVPAGSLPNLVTYQAWVLPPPRLGGDGGCAHVARPAGSGRVEPISVRLVLPARSRQWRVLRQLDDGPLTQIAEGVIGPGTPGLKAVVEALDDGMPATAARLCYFGQVADENGNWSPLGPLGCEDVIPAEISVPLLAEPQFEGDAGHPVVRLRWFCPADGVSHFRIALKPVAGAMPSQGGAQATAGAAGTVVAGKREVSWSSRLASTASKVLTVVSSEWATGPVGDSGLGKGPEFSYPMDVDAGVTYEVQVAAVDSRGNAGHASFARRFVWRLPRTLAERDVPWPERPLPPVRAVHPSLRAECLATNLVLWPGAGTATPVGVRIGSMPLGQRELPQDLLGLGTGEQGGRLLRLFVTRDAMEAGKGMESFLFTDVISRPAQPDFRPVNVVLYREQIPSAEYPDVSGDLVQVSPLLRKLAYRALPGNDGFEFLDPMVGLTLHVPAAGVAVAQPSRIDIHLLDLHPVVRGARYRYWLLHFDAYGEPDRTVPAGEVEVPL